MDSETHSSDSNNKRFNIEDLNIEILPIIYEIIRSVEKDNHHDNTTKTRDSQDCSQKVLELQKRLDQARAEGHMKQFVYLLEMTTRQQFLQRIQDAANEDIAIRNDPNFIPSVE